MGRPIAFGMGSALLLLLAIAGEARAQLYTGTLSDVVRDPSEAPLATAIVTLSDAGRDTRTAVQCDSSGRSLFRPLAPGIYSMKVEARGFAEFELRQVQIGMKLYF